MGVVESLIDGFFGYLITIVNAPLQPLLDLVKNLLSGQVSVELFGSIWGIMVYILSLFYGLLLLYAGFNFIISGHDIVKRENAKAWLRNVLIMTVLIQASYLLYQLVLGISSVLTSSVINMVDPHFFLFTFDNFINIGLELSFGGLYVVILLLTVVLLGIRYLVVSLGVIFAPLGIFLYFVPPLRAYGKLILNFLGINIFITFIDAIIILASSKMVDVGVFGSAEILLMISAFALVLFVTLYFMLFGVIKAAFNVAGEVTSKVGLIKAILGGA